MIIKIKLGISWYRNKKYVHLFYIKIYRTIQRKIVSSNNPLMDSTEKNNQDQKMAKTKVPSKDNSGSVSSVTEKQRN